MKKIPSLFIRNFDEEHLVLITRNVTPGCEWVLNGEGVATRKWDGKATLIQNGNIYYRFDCKEGRIPPLGFIPCCDPDPITKHWPGWIMFDKYNPFGEEKFYVRAYINTFGSLDAMPESGTYETCGPKICENAEHFQDYVMIKHGVDTLNVDRDFDSIKEFLLNTNIEGIVFHRHNFNVYGDEDMCKIKRTDFRIPWNGSIGKRFRKVKNRRR